MLIEVVFLVARDGSSGTLEAQNEKAIPPIITKKI